MSTTQAPDRFTTLPDDGTLAATVVALEAARDAVLARISKGSTVMTNTSVTLHDTGIAAAIDEGDEYAPHASYAWGAASVIFVVGAQKLVPETIASGRGSRPNSDVEKATGTAPTSFADFARRTAAAWAVGEAR